MATLSFSATNRFLINSKQINYLLEYLPQPPIGHLLNRWFLHEYRNDVRDPLQVFAILLQVAAIYGVRHISSNIFVPQQLQGG